MSLVFAHKGKQMFFHVIQPLPNSELVITTKRPQDHKFYTNWSCPVRQQILRPRMLLLLAADFFRIKLVFGRTFRLEEAGGCHRFAILDYGYCDGASISIQL